MSAERVVDLVAGEQLSPEIADLLSRTAGRVLELMFSEDTGIEVTLEVASPERVRELNRELRGRDSTTDVLSFPEFFEEDMAGGEGGEYSPFSDWFLKKAAGAGVRLPAPGEGEVPPVIFLGEIVIDLEFSLDWARRNGAKENEHLRLLAVHSLLHLAGLDHLDEISADAMEALEREVLKKL